MSGFSIPGRSHCVTAMLKKAREEDLVEDGKDCVYVTRHGEGMIEFGNGTTNTKMQKNLVADVCLCKQFIKCTK